MNDNLHEQRKTNGYTCACMEENQEYFMVNEEKVKGLFVYSF